MRHSRVSEDKNWRAACLPAHPLMRNSIRISYQLIKKRVYGSLCWILTRLVGYCKPVNHHHEPTSFVYLFPMSRRDQLPKTFNFHADYTACPNIHLLHRTIHRAYVGSSDHLPRQLLSALKPVGVLK